MMMGTEKTHGSPPPEYEYQSGRQLSYSPKRLNLDMEGGFRRATKLGGRQNHGRRARTTAWHGSPHLFGAARCVALRCVGIIPLSYTVPSWRCFVLTISLTLKKKDTVRRIYREFTKVLLRTVLRHACSPVRQNTYNDALDPPRALGYV